MKITDPKLNSPGRVKEWFAALHAAGIAFHPEDSFHDTVAIDTGLPRFTQTQAILMDAAMEDAYRLLDDPCATALEVLREREVLA